MQEEMENSERLDPLQATDRNISVYEAMSFLAGLYISLGAAWIAPPPDPGCGTCWWYYDITRPSNPYASVELGWSHEWRKVSLDIAARHESSPETGLDHGINSAELRVRWYPWR